MNSRTENKTVTSIETNFLQTSIYIYILAIAASVVRWNRFLLCKFIAIHVSFALHRCCLLACLLVFQCALPFHLLKSFKLYIAKHVRFKNSVAHAFTSYSAYTNSAYTWSPSCFHSRRFLNLPIAERHTHKYELNRVAESQFAVVVVVV